MSFDYDLGEREWFDARAGVGGPEIPPSVEISAVLINGVWVGTELFAKFWVDATEQRLLETELESV